MQREEFVSHAWFMKFIAPTFHGTQCVSHVQHLGILQIQQLPIHFVTLFLQFRFLDLKFNRILLEILKIKLSMKVIIFRFLITLYQQ